MAIQVRRGNEVDFDPDKMLPGEWAVSMDTKYVRMCFSPGICLRMATYEAFEADMAKIESILAEAQTIQEAVARIQTEINDTAVVVEDYSVLSKSYAVGGTGKRENEDVDNAKYYYEQAKHISQGGNGLIPLGTIAFENLPTEDILTNGMYNINNDFTSDDRFVDGGGVLYGKGSNVYYTVNGLWDVLAASDVKGVRGSAEDSFRQGNVTITPENLGLENVLPLLDLVKNSINLNSQNKASFDTVEGTTIGLPSGYYKVITVSNITADNTDGTEGFQIAVGYYGGNAIGKCYYRSWVNGTYEGWEGYATKNDLLEKYLLGKSPIADANTAEVGELLHVDASTANWNNSNAYLITIGGTGGQRCQFAIGINDPFIKTRVFNSVSWSDWDELVKKNDLDSLAHRQIAVGNFSVQAEGSYSVGVAVVTHGGNFGNTAYTAIVQQYTESDKTYLVNPPCIILGTKPIDGNSMYVYAINADGTAYTSSVWLSLVFVNKPLS